MKEDSEISFSFKQNPLVASLQYVTCARVYIPWITCSHLVDKIRLLYFGVEVHRTKVIYTYVHDDKKQLFKILDTL